MTSSLFTSKNSTSNLIASITIFIQNITDALSAKEPHLSLYLNNRKTIFYCFYFKMVSLGVGSQEKGLPKGL